MRILERYVLREHVFPFLLGFCVVIFLLTLFADSVSLLTKLTPVFVLGFFMSPRSALALGLGFFSSFCLSPTLSLELLPGLIFLLSPFPPLSSLPPQVFGLTPPGSFLGPYLRLLPFRLAHFRGRCL